jgi:hypothetical protein
MVLVSVAAERGEPVRVVIGEFLIDPFWTE